MVLPECGLPAQEACFDISEVCALLGVHGLVPELKALGRRLAGVILEQFAPHFKALSRRAALVDAHGMRHHVAAQEPP